MVKSGILTLRLFRASLPLLLLTIGAISVQAMGHGWRSYRETVPTQKPALEGLVIAIADGDTLDVLDDAKTSHRIRLLGIDSPERAQPFGKVARQALRERVIGKRVKVFVRSKDRYGRALGKVLLEGTDLNLEMVREGLAWHYKQYAEDQFPGDRGLYAQAESKARSSRVGLWAYPDPIQPWVWRRSHPRRRGP